MASGLTRREFLGAAGGAVAAGTLAQGATAQTGSDWLSLGNGPANTGRAGGGGPTGDPGSRWSADTGDSVSGGPVVVGDLVVVGSEDETLYGIDADSGGNRWEFDTEGEITTTPAVESGTAYAGDEQGFVYAVDTESGDEQWRFETGSEATSPTVFGGVVYVASSDGALHAIDAEEGLSVDPDTWPVSIGSDGESAPAVAREDESGRDEPTVYVGNGNGTVYAVGAETGETAWNTSVQDAQRIPTAPAVADGTVYVGSQGDGPQQGFLHSLDGASGDENWSFDTNGPVFGSPAVADGTVYVGSRSGELFAVSGGGEQWSFDAGQQIQAAPAVTGETVYVSSLSSEVFGVDRSSGEERWRFETNQQVISNPAVADGAVFVGSQDNFLYRLEDGATGGAADPNREGGPVPGPLERGERNDFTFLALPVIAGSFVALVAGGAYMAKRAGLLQRFSVDEAPIEEIYDDEEYIPDYDAPPSTDVWELVVGDVIARSEETGKTAEKNLIVSRYLDPDTLDSPVVAYEIESARSDTAVVRITESLADPEEMADQPLNEGWSVVDDELVYERPVEGGERVKTMVGRVDCPTDRADELRESPTVEIETGDDSASDDSTDEDSDNSAGEDGDDRG